VFGVQWQNLGYAGTFVVGLLAGVIVSIRLAKVIAGYLVDLRKRDRDEP
jgi:hypothetical protein